ncbi:hypothetical protein QBC35DRAFT_459309 [Podospora australis]|uniref:2-dehydropantoate 2-reductase n=1 Tax=Podospora australis TaxID=1536484 RepID=A0AAN7AMJ3_9PEZI|nr:hypothetical protein QBC35DRAFT_459309 [Podospora australis]
MDSADQSTGSAFFFLKNRDPKNLDEEIFAILFDVLALAYQSGLREHLRFARKPIPPGPQSAASLFLSPLRRRVEPRCRFVCHRYRKLTCERTLLLSRGFGAGIAHYHALPASPVNTGNLYLLQGGRPHLRGCALIPSRRTTWLYGDNAVGRGASQRLSLRWASDSTEKGGGQEGDGQEGEGQEPTPPEPSPKEPAPQALKAKDLKPFRKYVALPPQSAAWKSDVLPPAQRIRPGPFAISPHPDDGKTVKEVGARVTRVVKETPETPEPTTQGPDDATEIVDEAAVEGQPEAAVEGQQEAAVEGQQEEAVPQDKDEAWAARIKARLSLLNQPEQRPAAREAVPPFIPAQEQRFQPTDEIFVMGLDPVGRHIAHTLAGCHTIPPVRYLMHTPYLYKLWTDNRQIVLHRGEEMIPRKRIIGVDVGRLDLTQEEIDTGQVEVIKNLIITVPAGQAVRALASIAHRLDYRSTICLVNDGLGVAEAIIEAYFPSKLKRPVFILGHFTTKLGHTNHQFSVEEIRAGRLYLSLFEQTSDVRGIPNLIKRHPPIERTLMSQHMMRLLTAIPDLKASGHKMEDFFRYKLPTIAFKSIVDPLTVVLDATYDKLPGNAWVRFIIDKLIGELCGVIQRLPECRNPQKFKSVLMASDLHKHVLHTMVRRRTASSKMRTDAARGFDTDIDYLTGYFARRGADRRSPVQNLESLVDLVKAKQRVAQKRQDIVIPFEQ